MASATVCQGPAARASMDKKTPKKNRHSESGGGGGVAFLGRGGGGLGEPRGPGGAPIGPEETSAPAGTGPESSSPVVGGGQNGSASPPPGCAGPSLTEPPPVSHKVKLGAFRGYGVFRPQGRGRVCAQWLGGGGGACTGETPGGPGPGGLGRRGGPDIARRTAPPPPHAGHRGSWVPCVVLGSWVPCVVLGSWLLCVVLGSWVPCVVLGSSVSVLCRDHGVSMTFWDRRSPVLSSGYASSVFRSSRAFFCIEVSKKRGRTGRWRLWFFEGCCPGFGSQTNAARTLYSTFKDLASLWWHRGSNVAVAMDTLYSQLVLFSVMFPLLHHIFVL